MQTKLPIIALVDMEAFLASVEQALNPELIGKPVIVGGLPGTRGIVICCSYEARQLGVGFGMSLAEAHRRLPSAVFLKGDIKIYSDWWRQICTVFNEFTPLVEPVSMDEAYLDLTDSVAIYGNVEILSQKLQHAVKERFNVTCRIGIGSSKLFAKIACDLAKTKKLAGQKPIYIIHPDEELSILGGLPVDQLPNVGHKTGHLLGELGVSTIGQIRQVPREILEQLFGAYGRQWHDFARGVDKRQVKYAATPRSISRETTFNADSTDRKFLSGVLYYLLERLCLELRQKGIQTRRLTLKLRYVDFQTVDQPIALGFSCDSELEMLPYIFKAFDDLYQRKVGIRHVGISATGLCPVLRQLGLFQNQHDKQKHLSGGLDSVRQHFGYHAIFYGKTMALKNTFREVVDGYELRTPSLSL